MAVSHLPLKSPCASPPAASSSTGGRLAACVGRHGAHIIDRDSRYEWAYGHAACVTEKRAKPAIPTADHQVAGVAPLRESITQPSTLQR